MLSRALLLAGRLAATGQQQAASTSSRAVQPLGSLLQRCNFATNSTDIFNIHKDTPENNAATSFEFSEATLKVVNDIIARYPPNYKQSAIIPVLDVTQQENGGWLSLAAMNRVAKLLDMAPIRVYEVATFYTMFNRTKIGKYHVQICGTTPCRLQGSQKIEEAITKHLGIGIGQTTQDGLFTLGEMECMGACVNAPMVAIADYTKGVSGFEYIYYEDLTPKDIVNILDTIKKGGKPKPGSQYRLKAEPAGAVHGGEKWVPKDGETTLTGAPRAPYCRDLNATA
ncbi:hypothetical protein CHLRE_10g450400v5 [Chlamydomonas reinhardtii]|uniref:NADH:ubiquinone oxidoreductase 24 kD subunit n=1 Tax=Chlamydomonas reinhardtii TaxID=3055 RepID=Q6V9B3_CHLRE|nr:uncharacterized protein CHLRE_10g450400v5 [Chlamydomonas reinhardtii]AAQ63695.1 NADH:ubiquinone oxidoreductase 24 kD subunit [Chlamydomonas reinhardtii]PNW77756.1 hypothetical protein CHLRE_10g450400v5 [Chlamydomonas reinhardtii]|eukprot:XP_001698508.1 NADH:ubiquinone oxidoreductase 24 kDa subunit [Chlamydomonas reinhardtii]